MATTTGDRASQPKGMGVYALISPGADPRRHTLEIELAQSRLVRLVADSEDQALDAILGWFDAGAVWLIELGGGWRPGGVGRLASAVGERSIVTTRWFGAAGEPVRGTAQLRRANVWLYSSTVITRRMDTPSDLLWFVGAEDADAGIDACRRLVREEGVEILELCSDWGYEGAAEVQRAVGDHVRVGVSLHQALDARRRAEELYVPPLFARTSA